MSISELPAPDSTTGGNMLLFLCSKSLFGWFLTMIVFDFGTVARAGAGSNTFVFESSVSLFVTILGESRCRSRTASAVF